MLEKNIAGVEVKPLKKVIKPYKIRREGSFVNGFRYKGGTYGFDRHEAEKRGILYINLIRDIRQVPSSEMTKLFFQKNIKGFDKSKGHLTPMGNFFVAKKISEAIAGIDALATQ